MAKEARVGHVKPLGAGKSPVGTRLPVFAGGEKGEGSSDAAAATAHRHAPAAGEVRQSLGGDEGSLQGQGSGGRGGSAAVVFSCATWRLVERRFASLSELLQGGQSEEPGLARSTLSRHPPIHDGGPRGKVRRRQKQETMDDGYMVSSHPLSQVGEGTTSRSGTRKRGRLVLSDDDSWEQDGEREGETEEEGEGDNNREPPTLEPKGGGPPSSLLGVHEAVRSPQNTQSPIEKTPPVSRGNQDSAALAPEKGMQEKAEGGQGVRAGEENMRQKGEDLLRGSPAWDRGPKEGEEREERREGKGPGDRGKAGQGREETGQGRWVTGPLCGGGSRRQAPEGVSSREPMAPERDHGVPALQGAPGRRNVDGVKAKDPDQQSSYKGGHRETGEGERDKESAPEEIDQGKERAAKASKVGRWDSQLPLLSWEGTPGNSGLGHPGQASPLVVPAAREDETREGGTEPGVPEEIRSSIACASSQGPATALGTGEKPQGSEEVVPPAQTKSGKPNLLEADEIQRQVQMEEQGPLGVPGLTKGCENSGEGGEAGKSSCGSVCLVGMSESHTKWGNTGKGTSAPAHTRPQHTPGPETPDSAAPVLGVDKPAPEENVGHGEVTDSLYLFVIALPATAPLLGKNIAFTSGEEVGGLTPEERQSGLVTAGATNKSLLSVLPCSQWSVEGAMDDASLGKPCASSSAKSQPDARGGPVEAEPSCEQTTSPPALQGLAEPTRDDSARQEEQQGASGAEGLAGNLVPTTSRGVRQDATCQASLAGDGPLLATRSSEMAPQGDDSPLRAAATCGGDILGGQGAEKRGRAAAQVPDTLSIAEDAPLREMNQMSRGTQVPRGTQGGEGRGDGEEGKERRAEKELGPGNEGQEQGQATEEAAREGECEGESYGGGGGEKGKDIVEVAHIPKEVGRKLVQNRKRTMAEKDCFMELGSVGPRAAGKGGVEVEDVAQGGGVELLEPHQQLQQEDGRASGAEQKALGQDIVEVDPDKDKEEGGGRKEKNGRGRQAGGEDEDHAGEEEEDGEEEEAKRDREINGEGWKLGQARRRSADMECVPRAAPAPGLGRGVRLSSLLHSGQEAEETGSVSLSASLSGSSSANQPVKRRRGAGEQVCDARDPGVRDTGASVGEGTEELPRHGEKRQHQGETTGQQDEAGDGAHGAEGSPSALGREAVGETQERDRHGKRRARKRGRMGVEEIGSWSNSRRRQRGQRRTRLYFTQRPRAAQKQVNQAEYVEEGDDQPEAPLGKSWRRINELTQVGGSAAKQAEANKHEQPEQGPASTRARPDTLKPTSAQDRGFARSAYPEAKQVERKKNEQREDLWAPPSKGQGAKLQPRTPAGSSELNAEIMAGVESRSKGKTQEGRKSAAAESRAGCEDWDEAVGQGALAQVLRAEPAGDQPSGQGNREAAAAGAAAVQEGRGEGFTLGRARFRHCTGPGPLAVLRARRHAAAAAAALARAPQSQGGDTTIVAGIATAGVGAGVAAAAALAAAAAGGGAPAGTSGASGAGRSSRHGAAATGGYAGTTEDAGALQQSEVAGEGENSARGRSSGLIPGPGEAAADLGSQGPRIGRPRAGQPEEGCKVAADAMQGTLKRRRFSVPQRRMPSGGGLSAPQHFDGSNAALTPSPGPTAPGGAGLSDRQADSGHLPVLLKEQQQLLESLFTLIPKTKGHFDEGVGSTSKQGPQVGQGAGAGSSEGDEGQEPLEQVLRGACLRNQELQRLLLKGGASASPDEHSDRRGAADTTSIGLDGSRLGRRKQHNSNAASEGPHTLGDVSGPTMTQSAGDTGESAPAPPGGAQDARLPAHQESGGSIRTGTSSAGTEGCGQGSRGAHQESRVPREAGSRSRKPASTRRVPGSIQGLSDVGGDPGTPLRSAPPKAAPLDLDLNTTAEVQQSPRGTEGAGEAPGEGKASGVSGAGEHSGSSPVWGQWQSEVVRALASTEPLEGLMQKPAAGGGVEGQPTGTLQPAAIAVVDPLPCKTVRMEGKDGMHLNTGAQQVNGGTAPPAESQRLKDQGEGHSVQLLNRAALSPTAGPVVGHQRKVDQELRSGAAWLPSEPADKPGPGLQQNSQWPLRRWGQPEGFQRRSWQQAPGQAAHAPPVDSQEPTQQWNGATPEDSFRNGSTIRTGPFWTAAGTAQQACDSASGIQAPGQPSAPECQRLQPGLHQGQQQRLHHQQQWQQWQHHHQQQWAQHPSSEQEVFRLDSMNLWAKDRQGAEQHRCGSAVARQTLGQRDERVCSLPQVQRSETGNGAGRGQAWAPPVLEVSSVSRLIISRADGTGGAGALEGVVAGTRALQGSVMKLMGTNIPL